jgi:hypothetical protein
MAMQTEAWMTRSLFKEFLLFFNRFVVGVTIQLSFIDFGWAWFTHNIKSHRISARIWVKHGYPTFFIPHMHSNP